MKKDTGIKTKSKFRKVYDELNKDGALNLLYPVLLIVSLGIAYEKTNYSVYFETTCEECVKWKTRDNGESGRYYREWDECVKYKEYDCLENMVHFTLKPHQDSILGSDGIVRAYKEETD